MHDPCIDCPLQDSPYVPASGLQACKVFVVGTAPGEKEEEAKTPFVGPAGELVREAIEGLVDGNVFYTNVLKRRPVAYDGTNRKPSKQECWKCGSHLMKEIVKYEPQVVLTLGQMPLQFFTGKKLNVDKVHGLPFNLVKFQLAFVLIPAYDPSFVLRRGGLNSKVGDKWIGDIEEMARTVKNRAHD